MTGVALSVGLTRSSSRKSSKSEPAILENDLPGNNARSEWIDFLNGRDRMFVECSSFNPF